MNEKLTIKVQIKNVYGRELIYGACEKAKIFAHLVGQQTLTRENIKSIKALGYAVEVVSEVSAL